MKLAALTMVFNERHFLPIWINHYGRQLGRENLYVIDDGSDDGSTTGLGAVRVMRQPKARLDEHQRAARMSAIQAELLSVYDAVIVVDVDELLVVDPALGMDLAAYTEARVPAFASTTGLNVQHSRRDEPPLVTGAPLFRQRRFVQFDGGYCKTPLSRVPIKWGPGFHFSDRKPDYRNDLFLFHLRSVDVTISLERLHSFQRIERSDDAVALGHGLQFGLPAERYLAAYHFDDPALFRQAMPAEGFDSEIARMLDLLRQRQYETVESTRNTLMLLPTRFADCIEMPG